MKRKLMIAGAAFCAALFLFSGIMLFREYCDQKQSAETFEQVAALVIADSAPEEPESEKAKLWDRRFIGLNTLHSL